MTADTPRVDPAGADDARDDGSDHAGPRRLATVIPLLTSELGDRAHLSACLEAARAEGAGVLLNPGAALAVDGLGALRLAVRLAHEHGLQCSVQLAWSTLRDWLGELDLAGFAAGRQARELAHALHGQLPEVDGLVIAATDVPASSPLPDLSRAFADEFADRTGFSGPWYRLADHLPSLLTPGVANARLRCDFADTCDDLAFRFLSNLVTESIESFGPRFLFAMDAAVPLNLIPRPSAGSLGLELEWLPDYLRFSALCPLVFHDTDDLLARGLIDAVAKFGRYEPVLANGNRLWLSDSTVAGAGPRLAVIVNPHAALIELNASAYREQLERLLRRLTEHGLAFDLLTPELMTTSEMTETHGFRRGEHEYNLAIYPWPTIHTPYVWRELNGYLEERGRAIFLGPGPACLTDGTILGDDAKGNFAKATVEESDMIDRLRAVDVVAAGFMPADP